MKGAYATLHALAIGVRLGRFPWPGERERRVRRPRTPARTSVASASTTKPCWVGCVHRWERVASLGRGLSERVRVPIVDPWGSPAASARRAPGWRQDRQVASEVASGVGGVCLSGCEHGAGDRSARRDSRGSGARDDPPVQRVGDAIAGPQWATTTSCTGSDSSMAAARFATTRCEVWFATPPCVVNTLEALHSIRDHGPTARGRRDPRQPVRARGQTDP